MLVPGRFDHGIDFLPRSMGRYILFWDDSTFTSLADFLAVAVEPRLHVDGKIARVEHLVVTVAEDGDGHIIGGGDNKSVAIADVKHVEQGCFQPLGVVTCVDK